MKISGMKNAVGVDNTVAVHIRHIREKIENQPERTKISESRVGRRYKIEKQ